MRLRAVLFCLLLFSAALAGGAATLRWDSAADFDACTRDRYLDSLSAPGSVTLVRRVLIADEMGKGYNDYQPIRGKMQARKILLLDDRNVRSALLLVGGSVANCDIYINGALLPGAPLAKSYWHADFERYAVPPALLQRGANAIVFSARPGKSGSIRIENCQQPDRSAVSRDNGLSWDSDHLAEGGYCNGELQVRLSVERYAPQAWLQSPVIDLAAAVTAGGLPAGNEGVLADLRVDADIPRGTSAQLFFRTGATPDAHPEEWTGWHAWPQTKRTVTFARFAQWRLVLATTAAQQAPVVRAVEATVTARPAPAAPVAVSLVEDANQRIIRSSYDYAYSDYNGNLAVLRKNWNFAAANTGAGEIARLASLRQWVREQWRDGWETGALNYVPSWDARIILSLAPGNRSLGMCTHYATTYVQCTSALGYASRQVFVGHALSETWSNELGKWVVMDAGMDPNDRRRATYQIERNGVPLNLLELHNAYYREKKTNDIRVIATNMSEGTDKVEPAFPEKRDEFLKMAEEIFLPLRNNAIDHREPEEPEHGMGYFKFLGHLYWKDAYTPDVPWTDFFTSRPGDLYWTLNQAQIYLRTPGADGTIPVLLDTVTPNFAGYEIRVDDGPWTMATSAPAAKAFTLTPTGGCLGFSWKLHPGRNALEARPTNKAGHKGMVSRMVLEVLQ